LGGTQNSLRNLVGLISLVRPEAQTPQEIESIAAARPREAAIGATQDFMDASSRFLDLGTPLNSAKRKRPEAGASPENKSERKAARTRKP